MGVSIVICALALRLKLMSGKRKPEGSMSLDDVYPDRGAFHVNTFQADETFDQDTPNINLKTLSVDMMSFGTGLDIDINVQKHCKLNSSLFPYIIMQCRLSVSPFLLFR